MIGLETKPERGGGAEQLLKAERGVGRDANLLTRDALNPGTRYATCPGDGTRPVTKPGSYDMADMNDRTIAVARALATVDGKDPDEHMRCLGEGAGFRTSRESDDSPSLWEAYIGEAERFVAAIEAMQPCLERAKRW